MDPVWLEWLSIMRKQKSSYEEMAKTAIRVNDYEMAAAFVVVAQDIQELVDLVAGRLGREDPS